MGLESDGRYLCGIFLGVWTMRDGRAIVATLTTPVGSFDRIRAAVEPYLLTLGAN